MHTQTSIFTICVYSKGREKQECLERSNSFFSMILDIDTDIDIVFSLSFPLYFPSGRMQDFN